MLTANQQAKQATIDEIREKFERSQSVILLDYMGLTVEEVTALRTQFRTNNAEMKVYKNTLINRAVADMDLGEFTSHLEGPTAVIFSYDDPTAGPRVASSFIKKLKRNDLQIQLKAGALGTKYLSVKEVERLADLPTKEVMIAQLLATMNGVAAAFARVIDAIKAQKEETA